MMTPFQSFHRGLRPLRSTAHSARSVQSPFHLPRVAGEKCMPGRRRRSGGLNDLNGLNVLNGFLPSLGILARELWGLSFKSLLLPLQPRLSCPRAFEIVADLHTQTAQWLGFELDQVAVLERIQSTMIGSQREHITWFQRMDRADPLDTARDFVCHVA